MAIITDIELAAAMHLGDGVSTLSEPISSIVTRLNAVGQAYVQLYIPMAPDPIKNECIVRFASYLYDAPSASADGRFAAAWFNSGASALAAPFMALSVSGTAELAGGPGAPGMGIDQAAVNALISEAVYAWAQSENADQIPITKIPNLPARKITGLTVTGDLRSQAIYNALNDRVSAIELFETGLHERITLFDSTSIVAVSNAAVALPSAAWPVLRTEDEGETIRVSVSHRPSSALEHIGSYMFPLSRIQNLTPVTSGTLLTADNSINFSLHDSDGSERQFYLAIRNTGRQILFSSDTLATYTLDIERDLLDIESFAHISSLDTVPVSKIPTIPASKVSGLPSGGGGLSQSQVTALILAWARAGNTDTIPVAKIPSLPATKITGLPSGGSGSLSADDRARLDDLTYTTTTTTPGSTILARTNVDVFHANQAYIVGSATWPAESSTTYTITVWSRSASVYTLLGTFDITGTAIYAKAAASAPDIGYGTVNLSAANATSFTLNSTNFWIGRADNGAITFSSASALDFAISVAVGGTTTETKQTDLQSWARLSSADLIPTAKISGYVAGMTTAQIQALFAVWARAGDTSTLPVAKIPTLPASKITGLPSSGGGGLTQAQVQALIEDWAETGNADLIPIAKIPNLTASKITKVTELLPQTDVPTATRAVARSFIVGTATWPPRPSSTSEDKQFTVSVWGKKGSVYTHLIDYDIDLITTEYDSVYNENPIEENILFETPTSIQFAHGVIAFYLGRNAAGRIMFGTNQPTGSPAGQFDAYAIRISSENEEIQPWAQVDNAALIPRDKITAGYLNATAARGQATVTAANDDSGNIIAFGAVNQVAEGDFIAIQLDPTTTSDGNATVITRVPPTGEDTWISANEFQSESGVTDNVQVKLTNGSSYMSMQLERGSHSTAPKLIHGTYTIRRINL